MAYLDPIRIPKCLMCRIKKAVVTLVSNQNDRLGDYCGPCGKRRLRERTLLEKQMHQRQGDQ